MIDDAELLEVDDDYYAFLNLPRDVSTIFIASSSLFSRFAIHHLDYQFFSIFSSRQL